MTEFFSWFLDGLGTMLIGLLIGGATGWAGAKLHSRRMVQKARDNAQQFQIGGDMKGRP